MINFEYSDKNSDAPLAFASFDAMHTRMELLLVSINEDIARDITEQIYQYAISQDKRLNRFDPLSALSAVNSGTAGSRIAVDDQICTILNMCNTFKDATGGYFDICTGSGNYELDMKDRTVVMEQNAAIDLGGFAKGFVLEQIKLILQDAGVGCALVNFGNSSVMAIGSHPYGRYWSVSVENTESVHEIRLCDSAMSVSGITPEGICHIIDPLTGKYVRHSELMVVEGKSALVCEVLSTTLYAAPQSERAAIIANFHGYKANTK